MFTDHSKVSAYVDNLVLAAATAETITKPSGYASAIITVSASCWIRRGGTAAEPGADVVDGSGSIYIPAGGSRLVDFNDRTGDAALASISIISTGGSFVSVEWFL